MFWIAAGDDVITADGRGCRMVGRAFSLVSAPKLASGLQNGSVAVGDRLTTGGIVERLIAAALLSALAFYVVTTDAHYFR